MKRNFTLLSFFFTVAAFQLALAQSPTVFANRAHLLKLSDSLRISSEILKREAILKAQLAGIPVVEHHPDGGRSELQYFTEDGLPVYYSTKNAGSAKTISVNKLHSGSLGFRLTGKDILIGVWDGGAINDHVEFQGRAAQADGAQTISNHATHVTGTIIAGGINASARGMAYEANAIVFDWNNDLSEMAQQAAGGLLLSNHSYGLSVGWRWDSNSWKWSGAADQQQDYRFGFYTASQSQIIDRIAREAPYYLICWAAGNDRTDVGDGTRAPDGPFDSIGPEGAAKNILVVGAIHGLPNGYTGNPEDVRMSNFSSWGPVDDGRIKPDLVAKGVGVFSTSSSANNAYASLNGTSMATPAVTGGLALLQELNFKLYNKYLKSATLKAVAIHTAQEAGGAPGPDYMYGWGVFDASEAAKAILNNTAGKTTRVIEDKLENGKQAEYSFESDGKHPVKVTLVWTDVPGTPPAISINPRTPMLVNDLDVRIKDEGGNEVKPWTLDPEFPGADAVKADNVRDNVEVALLENPSPRKYSIVVSHKNTLVGGAQEYALILEYSSPLTENSSLYWIGGAGQWNSPANWSTTSGGTSANRLPDSDDNVVFDENSFKNSSGPVVISGQAYANSVRWFSRGTAVLDIQQDASLSLAGSMYINAGNVSFPGTGNLIFNGSDHLSTINFGNTRTAGWNLIFDNAEGLWTFESLLAVNSIRLDKGEVIARNLNLSANEIIISSGTMAVLDLEGSIVNAIKLMSISSAANIRSANKATLKFEAKDNSFFTFSNAGLNKYQTIEVTGGQGSFVGSIAVQNLIIREGKLEVRDDAEIMNLDVLPGATLALGDGVVLTLNHFNATGTLAKPVVLTSVAGKGFIKSLSHKKHCAEYLNVSNIDVLDNSTFNAGAAGILTNAENWFTTSCENVLFADFTATDVCSNSLIAFTNASTGEFASVIWDFGYADSTVNSSGMLNPVYLYHRPGNFDVKLTIRQLNGQEASVIKRLEVLQNHLQRPRIVVNDNLLSASIFSPTYQWYKDGAAIDGARSRTFNTLGEPGVYNVSITDGSCNAASLPLIINDIGSIRAEAAFSITPNPFRDKILIKGFIGSSKDLSVNVYTMQGYEIPVKSQFLGEMIQVDPVNYLPPGTYLMIINHQHKKYHKLIIKH